MHALRARPSFVAVFAVVALLAALVIMAPSAAQPAGCVPGPESDPLGSASFAYDRNVEGAFGGGWHPDYPVTLSVDGGGAIATDPAATPGQWDSARGLGIQPGQVITACNFADGSQYQTKTLVVTSVAVSSINAVTDVIAGTGPVGETVLVGPDGELQVTVESDGTWTANLSDVGIDIQTGDNGYAAIDEAAVDDFVGDSTRWSWQASQIIVNPVTDEVWMLGFTTNVALDIVGPAYSDTFSHDASGNAYVDLYGVIDIAAGTIVSASDDTPFSTGHTREHVVTDLTLDPQDGSALSGTATAGSEVWIDTFGEGEVSVAADLDGNWYYDPGVQGTGAVAQYDDDADSTQVSVGGPAWFLADQGLDSIWGHNFAANASVDVTIDGALFGNFPTDRGGYFAVPEGSPTLEIDTAVVVSDGVVTKDLTISDLVVTQVNAETNEVQGTGTAGAEIWIGDPNDPDYLASRTLTIPVGGAWSTDFDDPGDGGLTWDFGPGDQGFTHQSDDDLDVTHVAWGVPPDPWFTVQIANQYAQEAIWGGGWQPGHSVAVVFYDGPDPATASAIDWLEPVVIDPGGFFRIDAFDPAGVDVVPGYSVTVTDLTVTGGQARATVISGFTIDQVNLVEDYVEGSNGTPGHRLFVNLFEGHDCEGEGPGCNAETLVDGVGYWKVEFAGINDLHEGSVLGAFEDDGDGDTTAVIHGSTGGPGPEHWFSVETPHRVWGDGEAWPVGATVQVIVDDDDVFDTADPDSYLYEASTSVESWGTEPWEQGFNFDFEGSFEIVPGHIVSVIADFDDDGELDVDKDLEVVDIQIDSVDPESGIVSGRAPSEAWVHVNGGNQSGGAWRNVQADLAVPPAELAPFEANLAVPVGPGEEGDGVLAVPFTDGTGGSAQISDDDGDSTQRGWCVGCDGGGPGGPPHFNVHTNQDSVEGFNWPDGAVVHLEIDDLDPEVSPDFSMDVPVGDNQVGSAGNVGFQFAGQFDVLPGHLVTMTDGETTELHVVQSVEVTEVDVDNDIVSGTADAGDEIFVCAGCGEGVADRVVIADENGDWSADFSPLPEGEEDEANRGFMDIGPGSSGGAIESDPVNGNSTEWVWRVPNPVFNVEPQTWTVSGQDWIEGTEVTVTVDDPATPESPDVELTAPVERWEPWEPAGFGAGLDNPDEFTIEPGHIVTVSDGTTLKDHTVTALEVTGADAAADTVSGVADPDSEVLVFVHGDEGGGERQVTADGAGTWTADFATAGPDQEPTDLRPGMGIEAMQPDEDGDATTARWEIVQPRLTADQFDDIVRLDWPEIGVDFVVDVSDLGNGSGWTTQATTEQIGEFTWETGLVFDLYYDEPDRDVVTGTMIEVRDPDSGDVVRSLEVSRLTVTELDPDDDGTIRGLADPGATVQLGMGNSTGQAWRVAEADEDGSWIVNPGGNPAEGEQGEGMVGDVGWRFEVGMNVEQPDGDGDATVVRWEDYRMGGIAASPDSDIVFSHRWTGLWPATLTIEDSDGNPLYELTDIPLDRGPSVAEVDGEPVFFDVAEWEDHSTLELPFDIQPGHRVVVTDGLYTEATVVSEIALTEVDLASDVIRGTGTDGDLVLVFALALEPGEPYITNVRFVCTEEDGNWVADFGSDLVGPYEPDCLSPAAAAAPALGDGDVLPAFDLDHNTVVRGLASTTDSEDPFGNNPDDDDGTWVTWWTHLTDLEASPSVAEVDVDAVEFSATIDGTDPDVPARDVVTATVDWGDDSELTSATLTGPDGEGDIALSASHTYGTPGVHTVVVTVEFEDGHVEIEAYRYVVVYDPDGGFVTGGGWFESPDGAVNFGLNAKYKKNAAAPTGNTNVQLPAGDMHFQSDGYDWLVVVRDMAVYAGVGSIDGEPGYEFVVWVVDDGKNDTFRLWIGDPSGDVVYDNGVGGTPLSGGSIKVHA